MVQYQDINCKIVTIFFAYLLYNLWFIIEQ